MSVVTGQHFSKAFLQREADVRRSGLPNAPSVTLVWRPDRKAHFIAGLAGAVSFPFFVLASVASGLPFGIAAAFAISHLAATAPSVGLSDRIRLSRILSMLAAFWAGICVLTVSAGLAPVSFFGEAIAALAVAAFPLVVQGVSEPTDSKSLTERELSCLDIYSVDEAVIVTDETGRILGSTWAARTQIDGLDEKTCPDIFHVVKISDRPDLTTALLRCVEDQSQQECRVRMAAEQCSDFADLCIRPVPGSRVAITLVPAGDGDEEILMPADPVEQARNGRLRTEDASAETGTGTATRSGPADVGDVIDFAMRLMRQEADYAGLCVELTASDPDLNVACDRRTLIQIVVNVLGNAIKFSNFGGLVTVAFSRTNSTALIKIADQGIGIAEGDQERIFEAFDRSENGSRDGHGLGLSIVHDLVKDHGGLLELNSQPGSGTSVEIHLPLHGESPLRNPAEIDRQVFRAAAE